MFAATVSGGEKGESMSLSWDEMHEGVKDARRTMKVFQAFIRSIAELVQGNLRAGNIKHSTLCSLKRELSKYNMATGTWKD